MNAKPSVELKLIRFNDGKGQPFSAFIAMTEDQWATFNQQETKNLKLFEDSILLLVEGHMPSGKDQADAQIAFKNRYASITPQQSR